jgi:H+/Cl- antiporter ClcA
MRLLAYLWAFPVTAIGLCFALVAILSGGSVGRRGGVIEVAGGLVGFVLRGNRHWCGFLHG